MLGHCMVCCKQFRFDLLHPSQNLEGPLFSHHFIVLLCKTYFHLFIYLFIYFNAREYYWSKNLNRWAQSAKSKLSLLAMNWAKIIFVSSEHFRTGCCDTCRVISYWCWLATAAARRVSPVNCDTQDSYEPYQ